jgi:hypothetical protein
VIYHHQQQQQKKITANKLMPASSKAVKATRHEPSLNARNPPALQPMKNPMLSGTKTVPKNTQDSAFLTSQK